MKKANCEFDLDRLQIVENDTLKLWAKVLESPISTGNCEVEGKETGVIVFELRHVKELINQIKEAANEKEVR